MRYLLLGQVINEMGLVDRRDHSYTIIPRRI